MRPGRTQSDLQPLGARVSGLRLSTKVLLLVACACLAPAALVGIASYITVERIQADQVAHRLSEQAAGADRQVSRFVERRWVATQTIARSKALSGGMEAWYGARREADASEAARASSELGQLLSSARFHDGGYEGMALFDSADQLIVSTAPTALWNPEVAAARAPANGEGLILGTGPTALVYMHHLVHASDGRPVGRLLTVNRLQSLWHGLAAAFQETPMRLRIVDGRRHTLFDSDSHPLSSEAALPNSVGDQLLELRVGNASYLDENAVEVVAAHRFIPSLDLGALVELPSTEAVSASRRWREFAMGGSVLTVILLVVVFSVLALQVTGPFRALSRGVGELNTFDLLHRLPVSSRDDVGSITVAVNQLLDALDKSSRQLERFSSTDQLTGLFNRRHLDRMFEVELHRASRSGQPLSVLMIDLDHFMDFNERFGRSQGDAFLRHVASFLRTWLRATDVLARYGGEEFAALLPDTDRDTAIDIAERLRARFTESHPASFEAPITMSVGVATWAGGPTVQADLIEAADRAVLEAKQKGRNQVRFAA